MAIAKLRNEMAESKDPYVHVIGDFLISHVTKNPNDAEKIQAADKTIIKSLGAMAAEASKKKVGNHAVLTDAEGYEIVLKYFGIEGSAAPNTTLNLDDILGL
ncbi:hypothetical protein [Cohnella abietis]|uniref:Uncharacterized protein n=1 Tax=Cohnella abietis TaxID=2507935 RepID=A0A3T1D1T6_9BACL|nr:hypothetical protein [Cohnella abietis]BBI32018.1 hypothetical protein KCTCHS21_14170 [Cohnella abietis]